MQFGVRWQISKLFFTHGNSDSFQFGELKHLRAWWLLTAMQKDTFGGSNRLTQFWSSMSGIRESNSVDPVKQVMQDDGQTNPTQWLLNCRPSRNW